MNREQNLVILQVSEPEYRQARPWFEEAVERRGKDRYGGIIDREK